jgi:DNA polymerase III epsilon subunit-like protein
VADLCVLDIETTGLGLRGEPVAALELAAVLLDGRTLGEMGAFHTFIQPPAGCFVEEKAMEMHKNNGRDLEFFRTFGAPAVDAYKRFLAFLDDHGGDFYVAGQNVSQLDCRILDRDFTDFGFSRFKPLNLKYTVDLAPLAIALFQIVTPVLPRPSLAEISKHLGVVNDMPHSAMADARVAATCLQKLLGDLKGKTLGN